MRTNNFEYDLQINISLSPKGEYKIPANRFHVNILNLEIDEIERELRRHLDRTIYDLRLQLERELNPRYACSRVGMERLTPEYGVYLDGGDED